MRTKHQIYERIAFVNPLTHMRLLHHAAAQRHDQIGVVLLVIFKLADIAEHAVLGVLTHGTGVVKHQVRFFGTVAEVVAHFGEKPLDALAVRHVALTAVGVHVG